MPLLFRGHWIEPARENGVFPKEKRNCSKNKDDRVARPVSKIPDSESLRVAARREGEESVKRNSGFSLDPERTHDPPATAERPSDRTAAILSEKLASDKRSIRPLNDR